MPHSKHRDSRKWLQNHYPKLIAALLGLGLLGGGAYFATRKSPEDHLRAGTALFQSGDLKAARIEAKNALQKSPENAQARYLLGRIHFIAGDFQSAEKELKKARGLNLREPELELLLARTLLYLGQPKRVLEEFPAVAGQAPEQQAALLALRARAQFMLKDMAAAETGLAEADKHSPDHPESLATRAYIAFAGARKDEALALIDRALAKAESRPDLWLIRGNLLQDAKRDEDALKAYARTLALEPSNIPARLASVQLHVQAQALDKAENDLKELDQYAPGNLMGRYLHALVDYRRGRLQEAYPKLKEVLSKVPNHAPGNLLAGVVSLGLGKREEARSHLNKVLEVAPDNAPARKLLAATLTDLGDMDQARKVLDTFGDSASDPAVNLLHGEVALRQGHYAEARKYLENVPETLRKNPRYLASLAVSRSGSGDEAGAVQALAQVAAIDTQSIQPEVMLVVAHLRAKRFDEAAAVIDKLEKERPGDPLSPNLRGGLHLARGDRAQARASFARALQMEPGNFPATYSLAQMDVQDKDLKAARSRLETYLRQLPKEPRAWLALANLDAIQKNEPGYLKNLEEAKRADAKAMQPRRMLASYWLAKGDTGKALAEAREGLEVTRHPEFQEVIGLALSRQGDFVNALAAYKRWVEESPRNPLAYFRQAQAHLAQKEAEPALKALDKALSISPDFLDAKISKALVLGYLGRADEGVKVARAIQAAAPKDAAGYLTEADVLLAGKKPLDAARLYVKAAQLSGRGQPLSRAYQAYAVAGQAGEGQRQLEQWLKAHPEDAQVRHHLASLLLSGKQLREAAEHYRHLTRTRPGDQIAFNNLAWILGELNDPQALAMAEQAYRLSPDQPAAQDTLGWILANAGQSARGIDLLRAAHAKAPQSMEIHWHLAAALAKSGDRPRARQELEKLLERGQKFPQEAEARQLLDSLK